MERRLKQKPFSQRERRNGYRRVQKSIIGRNVRVGEVAKDVTLPDTYKNIPCSAGTNSNYRQKPRLAILIFYNGGTVHKEYPSRSRQSTPALIMLQTHKIG